MPGQSPETGKVKQTAKAIPERLDKTDGLSILAVPITERDNFIQRKSFCACGGFCPVCNKNGALLQAELKTDPVNDQYEQQADRIADAVVKPLSAPLPRNKVVSPLTISTLQRKPAEENEEELLPAEPSSSRAAPLYELSGKGRMLPENTLAFFESRMGYDFSQVKIHTDNNAAQSAQSVNARAYTTGNNIVFNRGQYAPDSHAGQHLLAHELTHVVQQRNALAPPIIQRQTHTHLSTPLSPEEEAAAANQGVSAEALVFRANQLIPVNARALNLPNTGQDCLASTEGETPQALLDRLKRSMGTRYFFMPAPGRPNRPGQTPDPLQDNGVLLAVECNYLIRRAALVAVASEVIDAYIRVPLRTGAAAIPASFRRPLVLLYNGGPISGVNNIGNGFGNTTVSIFLRRFGSRGARPVFHEFTHALLNPNRTFWSSSLSEGFASYIQGQFRPGDTTLTFPDVSNPHQCVVANGTYRNQALLRILGGRGAAPTDRAERKAFYTASWSFVYYLNTHARVRTEDTRRAAFLNIYQNGEAQYQTEYDRSRERMVQAWRRWVRREGRVRRGQAAPSCKPAIDTQSHLTQATAPSAGAIAQQGFTGPARQLPFLPALQQAFGTEHKLDQVRAYFDDSATSACNQLNAHAYTVGEQIAFKHSPTLNTVAHEASHVIQQRQGATSPTLELEQQANRIATQVERGQNDIISGILPRNKTPGEASAPGAASNRILQKQTADHIAGYALNAPVNQDFRDILAQQLQALTAISERQFGNRGNSEYGKLFEEARAFAGEIAAQMEALKTTEIRMLNGTDTMSFQRLSRMIDPRTPIWTHVSRLLGNPALAESAAIRSMLAQERAGQNADPFAAFQGRWRGIWYANPGDTQGFANDHDWQATGPVLVGPLPPGPGSNVRVQPVIMGPLAAGEPVRTTGINTTGPAQAAINAVDRSTGIITGAVVTYNGSGANRQRFIRQHVGYFLNNRTLIWVAREHTSLRSCFIEHRTADDIYYIMGLQFNWNSRSQTLSPATVMGGRYTQPQLTR